MFGPPPARLLRPSRSLGSPKPECASEPPSGLAAAVGLQLGAGVEIGVGVAIGVPAGGGRLALLVARKTAVASTCGEIATPDAERQLPSRGRCRVYCSDHSDGHQRPQRSAHGNLGLKGRPQADSFSKRASIHVRALNDRRVARNSLPPWKSIRGIDRAHPAAAAIGVRIGLASVVKGIFHALEKTTRSGGLAR